MNVDAPPDIIDVDEDDDFIDDEDVVPHDLADSDDVFLANDDDDDDVAIVYSNVARGHGGDSGGDDRPPPRPICTGCRGEAENPTGEAGKPGPQKIRFKFNDKGTLLPLGDHATQWSNLISEIIREFPIYYPCWHKIKPKKKAGVLGTLKQQFDLTPHIQSNLWPTIQKGIEQHLAKASDPDILRTSSKLIGISRLTIGLILRTLSEPFKMLKTGQRAKSSDDKDPGHLLSSEISRWESSEGLVSTSPSFQDYFVTNTIDGVILCAGERVEFNVGDADAQGSRRQYADGVLAGQGFSWTSSLSKSLDARTPATMLMSLKDENKKLRKEVNILITVVKSDDRMSQLLMQLYSQHEVGGGSGCGGGVDDESGADEDAGWDEDADGDEGSRPVYMDIASFARKPVK
ncbi:hypothetical protein Tco_0799987 [Tanacetum coccineum]|uniref:Transposase n=1 Tax=Tanacetum coccineum TaxID=301880 RepID=A0ABQ4ZRV8_9ASTR